MSEHGLSPHSFTIYNNTLVLAGEVNDLMVAKVLVFLATAPKSKTGGVNIFLNTGGGCVQSAREICRMIKSYGNVKVIGFSECMSAGVFILAAAKISAATPTCEIMIHYGEETNESASDKRRNNRMYRWSQKLLNDKVKVKKNSVTHWLNNEKYFSAKEALEKGLIDEIYEGM